MKYTLCVCECCELDKSEKWTRYQLPFWYVDTARCKKVNMRNCVAEVDTSMQLELLKSIASSIEGGVAEDVWW